MPWCIGLERAGIVLERAHIVSDRSSLLSDIRYVLSFGESFYANVVGYLRGQMKYYSYVDGFNKERSGFWKAERVFFVLVSKIPLKEKILNSRKWVLCLCVILYYFIVDYWIKYNFI